MSRNPKDVKRTVPTKARFNDMKFINWSLSDDERAACKAWALSLEDYDNALISLVEAGYKITISYDNYRSCFTCSVVATPDAKSNQGYILAGKGSTPLKAAKQALYIHFHIMGEDWAAYSTATAAEELDD
jgi:hypothetical protein